MKRYFLYLIAVITILASCKKPEDVTAINTQIELDPNTSAVKRVSGSYLAVEVNAAFKNANGFSSYKEGQFGLAEPDGKIQGGGYTFEVVPVDANSVQVFYSGESKNFARIKKASLGTYTITVSQNGNRTVYALRKDIKTRPAFIIERIQETNVGFVYYMKLQYHVNNDTNSPYYGEVYYGYGEVMPEPTGWVFATGDSYIVNLSMLRRVQVAQ